MRPHTITYLPTFPENPGNPGRCEVASGKIELNSEALRVLPGRRLCAATARIKEEE